MVDLTPLFQAGIALLAALVTAFLIPWIKGKLSADKQAELANWVGIAVTAAEQIYSGSGRGKEKKAYVLEFLTEKGYSLDTDKLLQSVNALIESAVFQLQHYQYEGRENETQYISDEEDDEDEDPQT